MMTPHEPTVRDGSEGDLVRPDTTFLLPAPSTSRFFLLELSLAAAGVFAASWFFVLTRPPRTQPVCPDEVAASDPDALREFIRCTDQLIAGQATITLAGPLVLGLLALVGWLLAPAWISWRCGVRSLEADDLARPFLDELARRSGVREKPQWCRDLGSDGWTFGRRPRYRVVLSLGLLSALRRTELGRHAVGPATAVVAHELAHLRNRDVDRTYRALAMLGAVAVVVAVPLAVDAFRRSGAVGFALGWRLLCVLTLAGLTATAVLRAREHDADLRVATDHDAVVRIALSESVRARATRAPRRPLWIRWHPDARRRLAVLADPTIVLRLLPLECFASGAAASLLLTELGPALGGLLAGTVPAGTPVAYVLAGVAVSVPLVGIIGLGAWRSQLVVPAWPRARILGSATALAAGLLAGSELSLRSAVHWQIYFVSAGDRDATPTLRFVHPLSGLLLVLVLVLICTLFVIWSIAAARRWIPTGAGSPLGNRWTGWAALGCLVLGMPLGGWFLMLRLAASGQWTPDVLVQALVSTAGVLVAAISALIAWLTLLIAPPNGHRPPGGQMVVAGLLGSLVLATSLVVPQSAIGWAAGTPVPPAGIRQGGYACVWLGQYGVAALGRLEDLGHQRDLGAYLVSTDDGRLRRIGRVLAAAEPGRPALLTIADLPADFQISTPERVDRPVSDRPECAATLDQLEVDPPREAGVGEARVLFSGDRELKVQHVVRRYPDAGADTVFGDAVATLANCGQFRLTYSDQSVFQVSVAARPIAPIGDEAWSATINVSTSLVQVTNTLVLVRKADRIAILSVSGLEQPDLGLIGDLTARVAQRLSAV